MWTARDLLALTACLLLAVNAIRADCPAEAPNALCCMGVALYSTNSAVWGGICGYYPPAGDDPVVGARCVPYNTASGCPGTTIGTCCKGTFPGQCALGTYCSGTPFPPPSSSSTSAIAASPTTATISSRADPTLPGNWTVAGPCMIRNYDSILHSTTALSNNTPANCAAYCGAGGDDGYPNTMAGVSNGTSCHCGDSYSYIFADRAYEDECNQPCAGDPTQTCGRHDRVQVYTRREIPEKPFLPAGWREVQKCAVDNVHRIFANITITKISENTHWVCARYCEDLGPQYLYAGTEDGAECHCGTGYKDGVVPPEVGFWECDTKCAGHGTIGCGGSWRINVYSRA